MVCYYGFFGFMSESLFFIQILLVGIFTLGAFRFGASALTAWIVLLSIIANLFVIKQVQLFGFEATASDAFALGSMLGLNLLQEYFGKEKAKKTTWVCLYSIFFFTLAAQLHLVFPASVHDKSQQAFHLILSPSLRLFLASLVTFFISQRFDLLCFAFLQKKLPHKSFAFRSLISLIASQCVDTFLFSLLGLYGIVSAIFDVFLLSFMLKTLAILLLTLFTRWTRRLHIQTA